MDAAKLIRIVADNSPPLEKALLEYALELLGDKEEVPKKDVLEDLSGPFTHTEVARLLGKTPASVCSYAQKHGIKTGEWTKADVEMYRLRCPRSSLR